MLSANQRLAKISPPKSRGSTRPTALPQLKKDIVSSRAAALLAQLKLLTLLVSSQIALRLPAQAVRAGRGVLLRAGGEQQAVGVGGLEGVEVAALVCRASCLK